jgi:hypothetical protein
MRYGGTRRDGTARTKPPYWWTPAGVAIQRVPCDFCHVPVGEPCVTVTERHPGVSGHVAKTVHVKDAPHMLRWERATREGHLPLRD